MFHCFKSLAFTNPPHKFFILNASLVDSLLVASFPFPFVFVFRAAAFALSRPTGRGTSSSVSSVPPELYSPETPSRVLLFVIFCNFFRIFWTPNGQKRLVATASTRGPIRSRHVDQSDRATSLSPALSPRQCLASLSPGRALQRGRERCDTARSRRARAPSSGASLSPAFRPRAGGSGLFSPALPPALALTSWNRSGYQSLLNKQALRKGN